jgi:hypothetical protein
MNNGLSSPPPTVTYFNAVQARVRQTPDRGINMAAKMIPLAQIWQIVIGQSMYEKLDSKQKNL